MSLVLAIDTAAPRLQLAVLRADGTSDVWVEAIARGHAEVLFSAIATLLTRNGLAYADLDRLVTTTGPGSFTGLRIGLAAARGLALALDIPVLGVPTLTALSLAGAPGEPLAVLVDARREEAYIQTFSAPGVPRDAARVLPMAEARASLSATGRLFETPFVDIAALARFAATLDPAAYPPTPLYVRTADAKPQHKARIAREGAL